MLTSVLDAAFQTISWLTLLLVFVLGMICGMMILFRTTGGDMALLLSRVKRIKIPVFEIELFEELNKLQESATKAADEVPSSPVILAASGTAEGTSSAHADAVVTTSSRVIPQSAAISLSDTGSLSAEERIEILTTKTSDVVVNEILDQATKDPKLALMRLKLELERELRNLMGNLGLLGNGRRATTMSQSIEALTKRHSLLPSSVLDAMRQFTSVFNLIIHGEDGTRDDVLRAIDSGLIVYRTLSSIPRSTHVVVHTGMEVFADAKGQERRSDVKAVMVEELSAGGAFRKRHVLPTTLNHFTESMPVAWEFSDKRSWGESWYRDPEKQTIEHGWKSAIEFVGRSLDVG